MLIFMLRWFLSQHLKRDMILNKYDRFVVTRTDHYYLCPQPYTEFDLGGKNLWVPESEDYGGYNDRHLVVGSSNIMDALDIVPQLIGKTFRYDYFKHYNSERFLKYSWSQKNFTVRRFPRGVFTCALAQDQGWKQRFVPIDFVPGLFMKYPSEYDVALKCLEDCCFSQDKTS